MKDDKKKSHIENQAGALLDQPIRLRDALRMVKLFYVQPRFPVLAVAPAAAAAAGLEAELGKEALKAGVSTLVGWLLGKGLEAGETAANSGDSGPGWREDGFDEIVLDDGPGGGHIFDGTAPTFGHISHSWPGCCDKDQPDKGIKLKVKVEVSDDSGDFWESDSGVRKIELNVHRINDREKSDVDSQQIDCKSFKQDELDDGVSEIVLEGCVPCSYLQNVNEVTVTIKATDWNGNIRIKKQTYTIPKDLKCCG